MIATSANISGEPVLTNAADVEQRLARCCDGSCTMTDRSKRPADDAVVRVIAGKPRSCDLGAG